MKNKKILAILLCITMLLGTLSAPVFSAEPETVEIDGVTHSFVSSFGKLIYDGSARTTFKTLKEGIAPIITSGGKLIVSGSHSFSTNKIGAGEALSVEGIGSSETGNCFSFSEAALSAASDLELANITYKAPEGTVLSMNGHDLTTKNSFDAFYTVDYKTNIRTYYPKISVVSGDASEEYSYQLGAGSFKTVALASGKVSADSKHEISGGTYDRVVAGSFEGETNAAMTLKITGGKIGELVIGAVSGKMNGNMNVEISGAEIEKISVGAYGAGASFEGSAKISITDSKVGEIGPGGDGKTNAKVICINAGEYTLPIADDSAVTTMVSVKGGSIVPAYSEDGSLSGLYCYDNYGCAAEKLVYDGGEILPENGIFILPGGKLSAEIISSVEVSVNAEANFVAGYEDGTFLPQNNMTKAEAVTLLTRTVVGDEEAVRNGKFTNRFSDVESDAWYAGYIGYFDTVGLLEKLYDEDKFNPNAPITRGEFVQLIYNIEKKLDATNPGVSYEEFLKLVYNVSANIGNSRKYTEFSDVEYTNTHGNAIYYAVVNGYVTGYADGSFAPEGNITRAEVVTVVNRFLGRVPTGNAGENSFSDTASHWAHGQILAAANPHGVSWTKTGEIGTAADGTSVPEFVKVCMEKGKKDSLADTVGLHVFKTASEACAAKDITAEQKAALWSTVSAIREEARDKNYRDSVGTPDDPNHYIRAYVGGPAIRDVVIKGNKPGTEPVEIVHSTDIHFNKMNELDFEENNPVLMSTYEYRKWLANGSSVTYAKSILNYARFSDQTIITGDILDYMSNGCKELTLKNLFWKDLDLLASLGNHEAAQVVEGKVPEKYSYQQKLPFLKEFWIHDTEYASKVVKDKVLCVILDNGTVRYWDKQVELFKADLEKARENDWVILIFQHIPLTTGNPADKEIMPITNSTNVKPENLYDNMGNGGGATGEIYKLITENADIVKGIFTGHEHVNLYSEILASYTDAEGNKVDAVIPQYVLTCGAYGSGSVIRISVE